MCTAGDETDAANGRNHNGTPGAELAKILIRSPLLQFMGDENGGLVGVHASIISFSCFTSVSSWSVERVRLKTSSWITWKRLRPRTNDQHSSAACTSRILMLQSQFLRLKFSVFVSRFEQFLAYDAQEPSYEHVLIATST